VLKRVLPSQEDRVRLKEISNEILSRIEHLAALRALSLKAMLVGSAARDTWLSGDHDLDIFLGVPIDGSLDAALEIARIVAPVHEEKYAEHAYVHARVNGFDVDLVPCYLVEDASKLKSAVDRTPFHTKYVAGKIVGLEGDVLLLKQFLKGVGVYGSELKVGGFSGYLSELLILRYGSFPEVLRAAKSWRPGEFIDLEGCGNNAHEEPLVVVDPVDSGRNVAAALTLDKMFQFVAASRCFLAEPSLDFFFPKSLDPVSDEELQVQINERGSSLILVLFHSPHVVEDVLFPQLHKAEESVKAMMERNGFSILRSEVGSFRDMAVMLFEMEVWELSKVCRRTGPPVWEEEHLSRFLAAHTRPLFGPYIREGRVVVEEPRKYTIACDLLAAEIGSLSLGKHLSKAIREAHDIYVGSELVGIKDDDFRIFLAHYFQGEKKIA
jgi:tRNA nucleotidyltransferase (CCA-adding enzyme)